MYSSPSSSSTSRSEATVAGGNLGILSIDATKLRSLVVCELVHGGLGEVEASSGVIDGQNVDGLAVVGDSVAGTALSGVPALYTLVATNAREGRNIGLCVPSILGDKTVCTV